MEPVLHHVQSPAPNENAWPSIAAASSELRRPRPLRAFSPRPTRKNASPGPLGRPRERSSENNVESPSSSAAANVAKPAP
jgi:hypothetical protein